MIATFEADSIGILLDPFINPPTTAQKEIIDSPTPRTILEDKDIINIRCVLFGC